MKSGLIIFSVLCATCAAIGAELSLSEKAEAMCQAQLYLTEQINKDTQGNNTQKEINKIINAVINKKNMDALTAEEKEFVDSYGIDLNRPIQMILHAGIAYDLRQKKEIGRDCVLINYFPQGVLKSQLARADFDNSGLISSEYPYSFAYLVKYTYKIDDKTNNQPPPPQPLTTVTPSIAMTSLNSSSMPRPGPFRELREGRIFEVKIDEYLIEGVIYDREAAEKKLGVKLEPMPKISPNVPLHFKLIESDDE